MITLVSAISPLIPGIMNILPPPYQVVAQGLVTVLGGVMAIYGRTKPEIGPITGIITAAK